jgi:hypothetical protein
VKVPSDGLVYTIIGKANMAIQLLLSNLFGGEGEGNRILIRRLSLESGPINRSTIETRRRSGF